MPVWIWHWSGYAVALLAFVGVVWALFWDRPRGRKRCRRCWYDLSGAGDLPADCPECGRAHAKPRHLTRTRRRWLRAAVLGLVMVIGGYGLWVVPRVQDEGKRGVVPTSLMVSVAPLISEEAHWPRLIRGNSNGHFFWDGRWREAPAWYRSIAIEFWYVVGWRRGDGEPSEFSSGSAVDLALRSEVRAGRLGRWRAGDWAAWAFGHEQIWIIGADWDDIGRFPASGICATGEVRFTFLEEGDDALSVETRALRTHRPRHIVPGRKARPYSEQPERIRILYCLIGAAGEYCRLVVTYRPQSRTGFTFVPESVERLPIEP